MHHPRADIAYLYIKRENGERGLIKVTLTFQTITIGLKRILRRYNRLNTAVSKYT